MNQHVISAFICGFLVACMMLLNGLLAKHTSMVWSSFITHGVGTLVTCCFLLAFWRGTPKTHGKTAPIFYYFTGVFGALVVIIANLTMNSIIGISGTIALFLLGQIVFSLSIDAMGWLGMPKKIPNTSNLVEILLVASGCFVILFYAR